jgi:hypothetical protein
MKHLKGESFQSKRLLVRQFPRIQRDLLRPQERSDLLASTAIRPFIMRFSFAQPKEALNLLSGRDGLLPTIEESVTADHGDWELVTWLAIIKPA